MSLLLTVLLLCSWFYLLVAARHTVVCGLSWEPAEAAEQNTSPDFTSCRGFIRRGFGLLLILLRSFWHDVPAARGCRMLVVFSSSCLTSFRCQVNQLDLICSLRLTVCFSICTSALIVKPLTPGWEEGIIFCLQRVGVIFFIYSILN